jgi:trimeric autotransporter adhesin
MSDINVQRPSGAPNIQPKQAQSAASDTSRSPRTASQNQRLPTPDPTDIITTSPEASAALGALNSQLSLSNTEAQKEFDAKQLKAAIQQLHLLQILGLGLGPEKLAKQTTDLAKQIAGIAKDYADNSGSTLPGAASSATASATSEADTAAAQANSAASTQAAGGNNAAGAAKTDADQASKTAKASADKAAQSAQTAAKNAQSAAGAATTPGASTPTAGATDASASSASSTSSASSASSVTNPDAATDPDKAIADSPGGFFAEVTAAFKDLKKLETKALSTLNLSPDQQKKKEAKKLGGEFNDAVLSTVQSASAAGVPPGELADQTIDLSKVTINISA